MTNTPKSNNPSFEERVQFQVSTRHINTPNTVKVIVYGSTNKLKKFNDVGEWAIGLTNKQSRSRIDTRYLDYHKHIVTIRLVKGKCPPEVVCHEIAHAACYLFTSERFTLSVDDIDSEERFCYIMGDLFAKINRKLHDYKVWS